jgi:hypothetical protein
MPDIPSRILIQITCVSKLLKLYSFHGSTVIVDVDFLIYEVLRSHSHTHTTLGRTPMDEWSALRRDLYLTKRNTHKRVTSVPPGRIRTRNPSKRAAVDPHLWPWRHWDRQRFILTWLLKKNNKTSRTNCLLIILERIVTMTRTAIIIHLEKSAAALSNIQCLTGLVILFHNCLPAPPSRPLTFFLWGHARNLMLQKDVKTQGRLLRRLLKLHTRVKAKRNELMQASCWIHRRARTCALRM